MTRVAGYCPACGGESLFLGNGGHATCSRLDCLDPCAADKILADRETEHIAVIRADDFTIRHPLHERIGGALESCRLHAHLSSLDGPPRREGEYRVRWSGERWTWEALS